MKAEYDKQKDTLLTSFDSSLIIDECCKMVKDLELTIIGNKNDWLQKRRECSQLRYKIDESIHDLVNELLICAHPDPNFDPLKEDVAWYHPTRVIPENLKTKITRIKNYVTALKKQVTDCESTCQGQADLLKLALTQTTALESENNELKKQLCIVNLQLKRQEITNHDQIKDLSTKCAQTLLHLIPLLTFSKQMNQKRTFLSNQIPPDKADINSHLESISNIIDFFYEIVSTLGQNTQKNLMIQPLNSIQPRVLRVLIIQSIIIIGLLLYIWKSK
jgi:hypothetical protein